jgi:hypothetical protein
MSTISTLSMRHETALRQEKHDECRDHFELQGQWRRRPCGEEFTMIDMAPPKIAQLVADARAELKRLGIDTEGKRSDELLNMVREQRNKPERLRPQAGGDRNAGVRRLAAVATHEEASQ